LPELDFESSASTNSAIPAKVPQKIERRRMSVGVALICPHAVEAALSRKSNFHSNAALPNADR
jgi:hypothetical protein